MNCQRKYLRSCYPFKTDIIRISDNKTRSNIARVRRCYRSEENIECFNRSNSRKKSFSMISNKNSESRVFMPSRSGLLKIDTKLRTDTIRSRSSNNAEIIKKEFKEKSQVSTLVEVCDRKCPPLMETVSCSKGKHKIEKKKKINKANLNSKEVIRKPLYEDEEKLKNEFIILENCFGELLINSKMNNGKSARNFSKLLLSIYRLTQEVRKKFFKSDDKDSAKKGDNRVSTTCVTDFSNISSLDIFTDSSNRIMEMACNSNGNSGRKMKNNIGSYRHKTTKQNVSVDCIDFEQPLRVDCDRLQLAELLNMSEVKIKSKCVVKTYGDFVEEQYLISALRHITGDERMSLEKGDCKKPQQSAFTCANECTCDVFDGPPLQARIDKSLQTNIRGQFTVQYRNAYAQTGAGNNSDTSIESLVDNTETCWHIDNMSDDELNFQKENEIISPSFNESTALDLSLTEIDTAKCSNCPSETQYYMLTPEENQYASVIKHCQSYSDIDKSIPELSIWTVHGVKVRCSCNYAEERMITPDVAMESKQSNACKSPLDCVSIEINLTNKIEQNILCPPCSLSTISKEVKAKSNKVAVKQHRNIPSPSSLNRLYARLTRLQEILECIPGEPITTPDSVHQIHSFQSNVPECRPICPSSLGDCSVNDRNLNGSMKQRAMIKTEIQRPNNCQPKLKAYPDNVDENLLDEDQSDATTSLSLLENLIDDFLTKNGLKKFTDV